MSRGETAASTTVAIHDATRVRRWQMPAADLALDERPGSPWVLVPPDVRRAFDLVAAAGRPLADTAFGTPLLGVKCGCNAAFVVDLAGDPAPGSFDEGSRSPSADVVAVRVGEPGAPARQGWVERSLLRPVVRRETLREWGRGGPRSVGDDATSRRGRGRTRAAGATAVDRVDARRVRRGSRSPPGDAAAAGRGLARPVAPPAGGPH